MGAPAMRKKSDETPDAITTDPSEIEGLISRVKASNLPERDVLLVERLLRLVLRFASIVERKNASIKLLKKLLFGPRSEKRSVSNPPAPTQGPDSPSAADSQQTGSNEGEPSQSTQPRRRRGHGRRGADAFTGAQTVVCHDPVLQPHGPCPHAHCAGRLYDTRDPLVFIRLVGQPSLGATRFEQEVLRCSRCADRFAAPLPEGVPAEKWDASADVQIVLDRYGASIPFHRSAQALSDAGIPVPASTLYERVVEVDSATRPVFDALERVAARGSVFCVDDTTVRILAKEIEAADPPPSGRTGRYTSGIMARVGNIEVALYYTGWRHAGENLERLLGLRPTDLPPPIEMADALSRNWVGSFERIVAKCLAHARRQFVTLSTIFSGESRRVLDDLAQIYKNDEKTRGMSDEARLAYHQEHSGPIFDALKRWIDEQMESGRVEPNGRLGKALGYARTHWEGLTRVLEVAGAPLDNNTVERILRLAVLQRKGSLFHKTWEGARVGARMLSLIQTCRLNGINAREYLIDVVRHAREVRERPDEWLPWVWAERAGGRARRAA